MTNPSGPHTGRPPTFAPSGMVTTPHVLASAAGSDILRRGGSAVDATIAANAVLCVAYPHMAGLGGDGFWLVHGGGEDGVEGVSAAGPAATLASRDYYRGRGLTSIPPRGPLAVLTVPGAVDGWRVAHERHGRLAWRELFGDAIRHAHDGVPVSRSLAEWLVRDVRVLVENGRAARTFLDDGRPLHVGEVLRQPELARSFEQIGEDGARAAFYEGPIAAAICEDLAAGGSPLRLEDFSAYRAEWVDPLSTTYHGHTVHEFAPPTQGFAALLILNLIEGFDVRAMGDGTADYYHYMAEAVKLAFADRDAWLTDPRFVTIPLDRFLDKAYAAERRARIQPHRALDLSSVEPGIPFQPGSPAVPVSPGVAAGGDTCAFSAVDGDGMVVSAIQSIYYDFGSAVMADETGILLQNRGAFFSLDEHHPNTLEPGKRTFHTLTPAMVTREGRPELALGTMGGEGQPQTHIAVLTRLLHYAYDVQQAIEAPRWLMGRTWGAPSRDLALEGRIADRVKRELERRGHPVRPLLDWDDQMGHANAIRVHRTTGLLEGGSDPRGDGAAIGF